MPGPNTGHENCNGLKRVKLYPGLSISVSWSWRSCHQNYGLVGWDYLWKAGITECPLYIDPSVETLKTPQLKFSLSNCHLSFSGWHSCQS